MTETYLVPADSQSAVSAEVKKCLNLGLLLSRYVTKEAVDAVSVKDDRGKEVGKGNSLWLVKVCERFKSNDPTLKPLVEQGYARWQRTTTGAERFSLQAVTRLIVGLGGKGALEIGITLQHVTGLPIIPGSALKGLTRAYALYTIAAKESFAPYREQLNDLDIALGEGKHNADPDAKLFARAFGSQASGGECVFYDSIAAQLPAKGTLFEADVMTPHFPDYYGGTKPPGDDQNPIPVTFLTVAAGTRFAFAVGVRQGAVRDEALMNQVIAWLVGGLDELGVGSKTAAGYGAFADRQPIR